MPAGYAYQPAASALVPDEVAVPVTESLSQPDMAVFVPLDRGHGVGKFVLGQAEAVGHQVADELDVHAPGGLEAEGRRATLAGWPVRSG